MIEARLTFVLLGATVQSAAKGVDGEKDMLVFDSQSHIHTHIPFFQVMRTPEIGIL